MKKRLTAPLLSAMCGTPWPAALPAAVKAPRVFYACVALFCLFFGALPVAFYGIVHTGVLALLLAGAAAALAYLYLPYAYRKLPHGYKLPHAVFFALLAVVTALYLGFCLSYRAYCRDSPPPAGDVPQTVIVLGGAIEGDRPKLMLSRRLSQAARYLEGNARAQCVVSGGQGPDEDYPEALVMRNYLIELGVDGGRVAMEGESKDTRQNIRFSARIIARQGFSRDVTVVSDAFHQPRAAYFCRENDLEPHAITSLTPWGLLPSYELREMGAWIKALLGW